MEGSRTRLSIPAYSSRSTPSREWNLLAPLERYVDIAGFDGCRKSRVPMLLLEHGDAFTKQQTHCVESSNADASTRVDLEFLVQE